MYGPNWSDPRRGVTGELNVKSKPAILHTYVDDQGVTRTKIQDSAEEAPQY